MLGLWLEILYNKIYIALTASIFYYRPYEIAEIQLKGNNMNRTLLKKAELKIAERRRNANDRARMYLEKAYKNSEFGNLYLKQKQEEVEIAKKLAYGEIPDYSTLETLTNAQEILLKEMGLNGTDISPNYECKLCDDTGYVKGKPCECLKKEINKELVEFSGLTHRLATFEENTTNHMAYNLMKKWCDTNSNKVNIIIAGHTGTGKTFLTECITSRLIERNRVVLFTTAFNLNNSMINYHNAIINPQRNEIIEPYLDTEVLIIDDLGTEKEYKNITKEYLYLILNERMMANKATIITTNLEMPDILALYGERIFSRLVNKKTSILINIDGDDKRLKTN